MRRTVLPGQEIILLNLGLNDKDLKVIKVKDLNTKLKQTGDLRKEDKVKIKKKRRAMKNRGYAATSRFQRSLEEKTLKNEKQKVEDDIRTIEEEKDYLEEKLAKLRESTRFRVAQSRALGIDLPEEYYNYLDEKK